MPLITSILIVTAAAGLLCLLVRSRWLLEAPFEVLCRAAGVIAELPVGS